MNQVDLHTHTTASDGALSPGQLVARAAHLGIKHLAITDHDTTGGLAEGAAAGAVLGVAVIPGVEINTDIPGAEIHVLGYFVEADHSELQEQLARIREGRVGRARKMAEVLTAMGAPITFERILAIAGEGSIGRPHVAQALLEAGHVANYGEAFAKYIGRNGPAYIERQKFSPAEACALIRRARGVPVLAHPVFFDRFGAIKSSFDLHHELPPMMAHGLAGIEVYYPGYDAVTIEHLLGVARQYRLTPTGGTDFHSVRPNDTDVGGIYVPAKVVRRLSETWARLNATAS